MFKAITVVALRSGCSGVAGPEGSKSGQRTREVQTFPLVLAGAAWCNRLSLSRRLATPRACDSGTRVMGEVGPSENRSRAVAETATCMTDAGEAIWGCGGRR